MSDRLAVCIGNNYPGTPFELSGCVNDAADWTELLARQGYLVTTLLDVDKATTLEHVTLAVEAAGWGDRVVVTFSGHGTWMPDVDGDEADRRDEALVAGDMSLIVDDELHAILERLHPQAGGLLLPDSCHSGTVSRFADVGVGGYPAPDSAAAGASPRFIPPTVFARNLSETRALELEDRAPSTPRETVNLISGARDDEYAWDAWFGDRANGAFTRAAIDAWEEGLSLAGWHRRIRGTLPSDDYPQTPQLITSSLYRRYADAL